MQIHIYQIAYNSETEANVSPMAKKLWIDNHQPELFEYQAYLKLLDEKIYKECDYIGVFSTKFSQKTRLSILDVIEWIQLNPGYDVYTFNPFPYICYLHFNQWEHGENCHQGIKALAQKIFDKYNLGNVEDAPRIKPIDALYCNFWVGTPNFFKNYVEFLKQIILFIWDEKNVYLEKTLHRGQLTHPFLPFILERMFSHYVLYCEKDMRKSAFMYPNDALDYTLDDLLPRDCDLTKMLLKIVRPHIDRLDAAYFKNTESQKQYRLNFNQITQMARSLIAKHQNPHDLMMSLAISSSLYLVY